MLAKTRLWKTQAKLYRSTPPDRLDMLKIRREIKRALEVLGSEPNEAALYLATAIYEIRK